MLERWKRFPWGYPLLFLLTASLGVLFLLFRETLPILAISIGVILILFAILFAVCTMADPARGALFGLKMVLAVLVLAAGIVVLIARAATMNVILSLFTFLILLDGAFKLQTTVLSRRYRLFGWWILLSLSLVLILGAGLLFREVEQVAADTAAVLLGLLLIVDGVANLLTAFFLTGYESRLRAQLLTELREKEAAASPSAEEPTAAPLPENATNEITE